MKIGNEGLRTLKVGHDHRLMEEKILKTSCLITGSLGGEGVQQFGGGGIFPCLLVYLYTIRCSVGSLDSVSYIPLLPLCLWPCNCKCICCKIN